MQPSQAADIMFAGLAERRFWILTHPEQGAPAIRARAEDTVTGRNPDDESVDPNFSRSHRPDALLAQRATGLKWLLWPVRCCAVPASRAASTAM
jgi:hypothetical protein